MAFQDFKQDIIESFSLEVKSGKIDPTIYDIKKRLVRTQYDEYINKIIALKPKEYFIDSFPVVSNEYEFFSIALYLVEKIFGEEYVKEFLDLINSRVFENKSESIFDGIALDVTAEDKTGKRFNLKAIEIPDFKHITSIIALLHEFTHYICDKRNFDYNKKMYYKEILSLYVEQRALEILASEFRLPLLKQKVTETRLEGIVWHYDTYPKEIAEFLKYIEALKKASKYNPLAKAQLDYIATQERWIKSDETIKNAELYRINHAASYGIGYLYSKALFVRNIEDAKGTNAKVASTLRGDITLQGLLDYYDINANNNRVFEIMDEHLENVRSKKL